MLIFLILNLGFVADRICMEYTVMKKINTNTNFRPERFKNSQSAKRCNHRIQCCSLCIFSACFTKAVSLKSERHFLWNAHVWLPVELGY